MIDKAHIPIFLLFICFLSIFFHLFLVFICPCPHLLSLYSSSATRIRGSCSAPSLTFVSLRYVTTSNEKTPLPHRQWRSVNLSQRQPSHPVGRTNSETYANPLRRFREDWRRAHGLWLTRTPTGPEAFLHLSLRLISLWLKPTWRTCTVLQGPRLATSVAFLADQLSTTVKLCHRTRDESRGFVAEP